MSVGVEGAVGDTAHVIFIDDDRDLLLAQMQGLQIAGFSVQSFSSASEALRHITADFDGAILSDIRMPHMDGLSLLRRVQAIDPEIPVVLLTGHGDVPMAVQALRDGAYDFLTKPCPMDDLIASLRRALQKRELVIENRQLRKTHLDNAASKTSLLGESPAMGHLRQMLLQIADADVDVLITGDTGAGKESAARALHKLSSRRNRPLVKINCASLSEDTFQFELFGAEAGSKFAGYGGSAHRSAGRLAKAHRGTLLLDDIEGLSLTQQAKLHGVLETREFWSMGAEEPRTLDIRVIATTKTDLEGALGRGEFRADLFYRLSGVTLRVPPLSERKGDIRVLFQHFLINACARLRRPIPKISVPVHEYLLHHSWPGNVRELEHYAERFALGLEDARLPGAAPGDVSQALADRVEAYEAEIIRETLSLIHGDAKAAMEKLKLARKTFYDKLARHGIRIDDFRK